MEFFRALADPDFVFLRYALAAGLLAAPAFGVIGTYVVVRRMSYLAGAIAHCVLGGIGAALYCQARFQLSWLTPMTGAIIAALGSALLIGWLSLRGRERLDSLIGAIWVLGMAAGLLFLAKTPGYVDPMSYLFGDILMIGRADLLTILALDLLILLLGLAGYQRMLALCFDPEFARLRGLPVDGLSLLLFCLTALTIVLMVRVVGIVLVIALFTLPAAAASQFGRSLWQTMAGATLITMLAVTPFYVLTGTMLAPELWADPLGPLTKIGPLMVATAFTLAVLDER